MTHLWLKLSQTWYFKSKPKPHFKTTAGRSVHKPCDFNDCLCCYFYSDLIYVGSNNNLWKCKCSISPLDTLLIVWYSPSLSKQKLRNKILWLKFSNIQIQVSLSFLLSENQNVSFIANLCTHQGKGRGRVHLSESLVDKGGIGMTFPLRKQCAQCLKKSAQISTVQHLI